MHVMLRRLHSTRPFTGWFTGWFAGLFGGFCGCCAFVIATSLPLAAHAAESAPASAAAAQAGASTGAAVAGAPGAGASPSAGPDCSRPLTLGLHEHGVLYAVQTGEGIDKDIADEMARRSGCHITLTVLPRARIWQLVESGALDFTLSGISNADRDRFARFAWYVSNKYYLLARRDVRLRSVDDFLQRRSLRVGVIRGFRYSPSANGFVDTLDAAQRVSYATGLDPLYAILLDNQIQAMIIEPFDYPVIESERLRAQTVVLEFADAAVPHGLVMSRKSLSPAQQEAWRAVIDGMRTDGTIERIFEKYFPADLARTMTRF